MRKFLRAAVVVVVGILLPAGHLAAAELSPEERYAAATKILSTCQYCFDIRDTPEDMKALDEMWTAIEGWTVGYLNSHPEVSIEKFDTALLNAQVGSLPAPNWVKKLGPDLFGFGTSYSEIGTAFLVGKRDGRYRVVWDIRRLPAGDISRFPILASWTVERARETCRSKTDEGKWNQCGPIHGDFQLLPPDSRGNVRFYLDATYAQAAGETVGGQISIWSWNGETATPLLARSYTYDFEDFGVHFSGGLLKVRAKDEYQSYYSCGACLGRRMDWTIRITPDRVTDQGMTPLYPELDVVDSLFQRMAGRQVATDLASSRVIAKLTKLLEPVSDKNTGSPAFDLEMLDDSSVRRVNGRALACISVDAVDNGIVFTIEKRDGRDFITNVDLMLSRRGGKC
jgi:hypothetical protein